MKKYALTSIVVLSAFLSHAQWQPDVRLTNNIAFSYTSANNAWCVASNGLVVHVVWYDRCDGNMEIYYKRSIDGGISWEADTRLTNNISTSQLPSVAVSGSDVYVVWNDYRDGNWEIYYKHSTDAGLNWSSDLRLTINPALSLSPSVAVSGADVHVVWRDFRDSNHEVYYKHSTNSGTTWSADTRLTNNTSISGDPSVAVSGSVVLVVWSDGRDGNPEIYFKNSTDAGGSWEADTRLTNNSTDSQLPSIAVSGQDVHVVWSDYDESNHEVYYKHSANSGTTWSTDIPLTNNTAISGNPSVAASGSNVHVVWNDSRDGNSEIYYNRSTNSGVSWEADTRLTNNNADSYSSSVAVSDSVVHVVWNDSHDGNFEIYYKRSPTSTLTVINDAGTQIPKGFSLSQNYPNPFSTRTTISWVLQNNAHVVLNIYGFTGYLVKTLVDCKQIEGEHTINFDASGLPTGVYFYQLQADGIIETKKMVHIK